MYNCSTVQCISTSSINVEEEGKEEVSEVR
jgi:hypothetical protein